MAEMGDSDLEADEEAVSEGLYFRCKAGFEAETTLAWLITAGGCCFPAELTKFDPWPCPCWTFVLG